jgi:site-specific recombinase XerD
MPQTSEQLQTRLAVYPALRQWVDGFLVAKRAGGAARRTLDFYRARLAEFVSFCEKRNVSTIETIDAGLLREFLLVLAEAGHNPGGVHSYFRIVKAFLRWYEREAEPDGWRNPIRKVDPPKVPEQLLEPVDLATIARLVQACGADPLGLRDRAILLTLLDTGVRAGELVAFDLADFDALGGTLAVRRGKGGQGRLVFLGFKARKAVRAYLKVRGRFAGPLFATRDGDRLRYTGLKSMVRRRAGQAGVARPQLHAFRRAFALEMLRAGADLLSLQRLLGHADLSVLRRYVKQNVEDLRAVHARHSPADNAEW